MNILPIFILLYGYLKAKENGKDMQSITHFKNRLSVNLISITTSGYQHNTVVTVPQETYMDLKPIIIT